MRQVTLRLTDEQYNAIKALADKKKLSISDFLLGKSLPNHFDDILTIDKVLEKIKKKKMIGEMFSLRDLFSDSEWDKFKPGSRISTGRMFFKNYEDDDFGVVFVKKNSANLAIYKKVKETKKNEK